MPIESSRRRFMAFVSLVLSAAGTGIAYGQGGGDYSSTSPTPRRQQQMGPERPIRPGGIPEDPAATVVEDVGSWHIVSAFNQSRASIPAERVELLQGGVEGSVLGSSTLQAPARGVSAAGVIGSPTKSDPGAANGETIDPGRRILFGGRVDLTLEYWSIDTRYGGVFRISTTSNGQAKMPATILLDDRPIRSVIVDGFIDIPVAELFGPDLGRLVEARSLRVVAEIEGASHPIYEVNLMGTADALAQMRVLPDYNYNVRRLGRESVAEEMRDSQTAPANQCFLTTACCDVVGLRDDCFELRSLRHFRDRIMLDSEFGRIEVAHYYATAPQILAEMRRRRETTRLRWLYFSTILPCAIMARMGLSRATHRLYAHMMRALESRYC